ncbi:MAG: hypothetical protein HUJ27_13885 [Rhodobacteraceae bacterium]|nr:hypothetical protein [Paracoccaceae bacterium]
MSAEPSARLLDVTRLVRRARRGTLTGIDRVELAYLDHFVDAEVPAFGLVRTKFGYLLLDRAGLRGFASVLREASSSPILWIALRHWAIARSLPQLLGRMLRRHLPWGSEYFNVGHSNLTNRVFAAVRSVPGSRFPVPGSRFPVRASR